MAIHNTSSDSANTAVRAFLTKIGEHYWKSTFNIGSGSSKRIWEKIRDEVFNSSCAYCGINGVKLQVEHLIMFNREQYGLHHPGNIVPCCGPCNKRRRDSDKNYLSWEKHLEAICKERDDLNSFFLRRDKIVDHTNGEFKYPILNESENHSIRVIANALYENIKMESEKALGMYIQLDKAFIQKGQ